MARARSTFPSWAGLRPFTRAAAVVFAGLLAIATLHPVFASADPVFLTQWTGFVSPEAIALGPSGAVYVLDAGCPCVKKFDANGNLLLSWGSSGSNPGQFDTATDLTVDASGNVYVTDRVLERVQKFDANGGFLLMWGQPGFETGSFDEVRSISSEAGGTIVTLDGPDGRVQRFDPSGGFLSSWPAWLDSGAPKDFGSAEGFGPADHILIPLRLEVESTGFVSLSYVGFGGSNVFRYDLDGNLIGSVSSPDQGAPPYYWAKGVGSDGAGRLYTTDVGANRVLVFDSMGTPIAVWGSTGTRPGEFQDPVDATGTSSGRIYVVDKGNSRVQVFQLGVVSVPGPPRPTPALFRLLAEPTPFSRATTLSYVLLEPAEVSIRIYDLSGRVVASLMEREARPAGVHRIRFDATGLPSGMYLYHVDAGRLGSRALKILRATARGL